MTVEVVPADPGAKEARALLDRLDAEVLPHDPSSGRFAYSVDDMRARGVRFFVARRDGAAVGCAGLEVQGQAGELKRMFVATEARGSGVADALMDRVEDEARTLGLKAMRLETGTAQHAAIRFYHRRGYRDVDAYGEYEGSPTSVCMERRLD